MIRRTHDRQCMSSPLARETVLRGVEWNRCSCPRHITPPLSACKLLKIHDNVGEVRLTFACAENDIIVSSAEVCRRAKASSMSSNWPLLELHGMNLLDGGLQPICMAKRKS